MKGKRRTKKKKPKESKRKTGNEEWKERKEGR